MHLLFQRNIGQRGNPCNKPKYGLWGTFFFFFFLDEAEEAEEADDAEVAEEAEVEVEEVEEEEADADAAYAFWFSAMPFCRSHRYLKISGTRSFTDFGPK